MAVAGNRWGGSMLLLPSLDASKTYEMGGLDKRSGNMC